jgi:hypothetical protein
MFLPDVENRVLYTYSSNLITINLTLSMEKLNECYKLFILEGPFIGKYHAVLGENENEITVISFGKGLFYGRINQENIRNPLFNIAKNSITESEIKIQNKYILRCYEKSTVLQLSHKTYENCMLFNLIYESGKYIIYIKEGLGIIMVRNIKNDRIVEEILIKEA